MKALLAMLLLSLLLTSGSSLECETCVAQMNTCSGTNQSCHSGQDACISIVTEVSTGIAQLITAMKACTEMAACKEIKPGSTGGFGGVGGRVIKVQCSKAPESSGTFLLALSSLLLLKLFL